VNILILQFKIRDFYLSATIACLQDYRSKMIAIKWQAETTRQTYRERAELHNNCVATVGDVIQRS